MKTLIFLYKYYFNLTGFKFLILGFLMILGIGLECFGVSFILPFFQGLKEKNTINDFLRAFCEFLNIPFEIKYLLLIVLCVSFLRAFFIFIQTLIISKIKVNLLVSIRKRLLRKVFGLEYQNYLNYTTGYTNNALNRESDGVVNTFEKLVNFTVQIVTSIAFLLFPLFLEPLLITTISLIFLPVLMIFKFVAKKTKYYSVKLSEKSASFQKFTLEALNSFKYLKATGNTQKLSYFIDKEIKETGEYEYKRTLISGINLYTFEFIMTIVICAMIYYFTEIQKEELMSKMIVLFMLMKSLNGMKGLQKMIRRILSSWGSLKVIDKFENKLDSQQEYLLGNISICDLNGDIKLNNLSFKYKNGKEILNNINLTIKNNSSVAFVGESGVGKSTIIDLIIGLLEPTEGFIEVNKNKYSDFNKAELRKNIGYITQDNIIFNDTIINNITLWNKDVPKKSVENICKKASIHNFINDLNLGYNTILGEHGMNLSGGQKQRICIARELYKNSKIIVFDEATSTLDSETEREIQKNIDDLKGKKTILIIAHRLSTIKNVDCIYLLKNGKIADYGGYDELYETSPEFKKMVHLQK